jgi:Mrp family chromosome partitioning ATPase
MFDFVRKPIWSMTDVGSIRTIGALAPRRMSASRGDAWYSYSPQGRRLEDIQAIRASIDDVIGHGPVAIGMARIGTSPRELKAAAADLAASLAAVGNSVLLIDADFSAESDFPEYGVGDPALAELLTASAETAVLRVMVKEALEEIEPVVPGLRGMAAGHVERNSADLLAGPSFEVVLSEARELADVILVVCSVATDASTLTLAQRLDYMSVIAKARSTRVSELEEAASVLEARRAGFLGAILLDRKRRSASRPAGIHKSKSK